MLLTNQQLDKLAAARVDFQARGMLNTPLIPSENPLEELHIPILDVLEDDDGDGVDGEVLAEVTLARK